MRYSWIRSILLLNVKSDNEDWYSNNNQPVLVNLKFLLLREPQYWMEWRAMIDIKCYVYF